MNGYVHSGTHFLPDPVGKKTDFHKQSSKVGNNYLCSDGLVFSSAKSLLDYVLIIRLLIQVVKHEFWHHVSDPDSLKYDV